MIVIKIKYSILLIIMLLFLTGCSSISEDMAGDFLRGYKEGNQDAISVNMVDQESVPSIDSFLIFKTDEMNGEIIKAMGRLSWLVDKNNNTGEEVIITARASSADITGMVEMAKELAFGDNVPTELTVEDEKELAEAMDSINESNDVPRVVSEMRFVIIKDESGNSAIKSVEMDNLYNPIRP